ncbi:hypothetical protein [Haloglycomyces albus]|uniref:hypothetical protein n=1 Tax=Haloglycomyces albus TaxID=526067 RepID=UPI00046D0441|nr:hypothetical protein [Haloglycomyces albus]
MAERPDGRTAVSGRSVGRVRKRLADSGSRIQRMRNLCLTVVAVAAVGVAVLLSAGHVLTTDPTRRALDELRVPSWAAQHGDDDTYGSRWCLEECRVRVRTWQSDGLAGDTSIQYLQTLLDNDWLVVPKTDCPGGSDVEACFTRDELFLEMWVRQAECSNRYELCVGSNVTIIVASQAAWPRLAEQDFTPSTPLPRE